MDNLTHSLLGAAIAEVYVEKKFKHSALRPPKNIFYFFSIFANNCPDLDLLFGLIDNSSLGYMLNHRGWTHTVAGTVPQTALLMVFAWLWLRFVRQDLMVYLKDFILLIFLGMQAHMLLDFFNSYGVHPLAPFDNSWYYLDSIFIIEPLLWFALISVWLPPWKWRRLALLVPPLTAYAFGWWYQFVPTAVLLTAIVLAILAFNLQRYLLKVHRGAIGLLLFFTVVLTFWSSQHWARLRITAELAKDSSQKTLDLVLFSLPSNPTCWFFLAPQVSETQYNVIHGSLSLFGNSRDCKSWPRSSDQQPPVEQAALGELWIRRRWQASLADLQPLLERCDVQAWLQFARVPYWENSVLNDLRFATRYGNNMSTHDLNKWPQPVCPVLQVPWKPPRQDLIDLVKTIPR